MFSRLADFVTKTFFKLGKVEKVSKMEANGPNRRIKPKTRKFAMCLTYCGQNYLGMQRNPGIATIEEEVLKTMLKIELINKEQYLNTKTFNFQRSARTDKHVSACQQVVSFKAREDCKNFLEKFNQTLPGEIRVMDIKRVTQGFDAKNYCEARTYAYMLPTFAFMSKTEQVNRDFRISSEALVRFNKILQEYLGTHKFHNFTSGKTSKDTNAYRVIKKIDCGEPFFPCGQKEIEYVVIRVKGQSFMLHQIRKMVGMAVAIFRGYAPEEDILRAMGVEQVDIPIAPGVGLMLEATHFDQYDRRFGNDGVHEPIKWDHVSENITKFKYDNIYPVIVDADLKKDSFMEWLKTLDYHYSSVHTTKTAIVPPKSPQLEDKSNSDLKIETIS